MPNAADQAWNEFEAQNDDKTFFGGPLSWLNNLSATGEDLWQSVTGSDEPDKRWGCADAAPALQQHMARSLEGTGQTADVHTTRNWLGLQHNQTVAHNRDGSAGGEKVYDSWAGNTQELPEHFDNTLLPVGQALEFVADLAIGGSGQVDPTGYGDRKAVTGNTRLDMVTPVGNAMDRAGRFFTGLFD